MNPGYLRLNWSCLCSDEGVGNGTLIAAWNAGDGSLCKIVAFDNHCTQTAVATEITLTGTITDIAVANSEDTIYIAYTVNNSGVYTVNVTSYTAAGGFVTPVFVSGPDIASHVQFFNLTNTTVLLAFEDNDRVAVAQIDLSTFNVTDSFFELKGTAGTSAFLYWLESPTGTYWLLRGFNTTSPNSSVVETYPVIFSPLSISPSVPTSITGNLYPITTCATCQNYLVIGGALSGIAKIQQFTVLGGSLTPGIAKSFSGTTIVSRAEICCCSESQLAVGTDGLLTTLDPTSLATISAIPFVYSSDVCWCCTGTTTLGIIQLSGVVNIGNIISQGSGTFQVVCELLPFPPA